MPPTQMQNGSPEIKPIEPNTTWTQAPEPKHGIKRVAVSLLVVMLLVGASLYAYTKYFVRGDSVDLNENNTGVLVYDGTDLGVTFSYPNTYFAQVRSVSTNEEINPTTEIRNVTIVEDTEINRSILDGTYTEAVEGPTAITLDVYLNPQGLGAEGWAQQDLDWVVGKTKVADVSYGGRAGVVYNWDGLYPGKSVVITKDDIAYVFSVTWITPDDQILKDFELVLNSIVLGE